MKRGAFVKCQHLIWRRALFDRWEGENMVGGQMGRGDESAALSSGNQSLIPTRQFAIHIFQLALGGQNIQMTYWI